MNLQDVSHIHIPDGDVRMIHDSDNRLLWGAVGYNVLFSGDTFQQSYTGKNLFDNSTLYHGYYNLTSPYTKVADEKYRTVDMTLKAGTYTFSCNLTNCYILRWLGDNTNHVVNITKNTLTFTTTTDGTVMVCIRNASSSTITQDVKCQVELGSTATSYEPYVGGTPSPNPEYPQPIQTVTGLQTVEVRGKNLLSSVWEPGSYNGTNGAKQDSANTYRTAEKIAVQSDTTYIVSRDSAGVAMNYYEYDENGNFLTYNLRSANQPVTTGHTTKFITMGRSQNGGIEKMMLERGSTVTAYEPYSSHDYEINLGKNLFDNLLSPIYSTGVTSEPLSTGIRISTTVIQGNCFCGFRLFKSSDFVGKTITLSANVTASASNKPNAYIGLCAEDGSSRSAKVFMTGTGEKSVSYTHTTEDTSRPYIMVALYSSYAGGTTQIGDYADYNNLQLEVGSATPYSPYFEPIELCKLGDYQDYIYKDGDDWKIHKETIKKAFSDSTTWRWDGSIPRLYMDATSWGVAVPPDIYTPVLAFSTKFKTGSFHYIYNQKNNGFAFSYSSYATVVDKRWESEEDARAAFAETTFYLAAATPTETTITNQALIEQLEAIYNLVRRYGYNFVVSASGNNLPIIIDRTLL